MTIIDTIFKALQPAIPDRVIAGHHADLVAPSFHGFNPQTVGRSSSAPSARSAAAGAPRRPRTACRRPSASTTATPTTARTSRPRRNFRSWSSASSSFQDSGGAGRHRGGLGIARTTRALTSVTVNTQSDRSHCPPWGLDGGGEATGNNVAFRAQRRMEGRFPQRQGAGGAAQAGRRVPHLVGRRRRLRRAVRAADRGRARGRAPGLCVGEGGGRALRRGGRSARPLRSIRRRRKNCARRRGSAFSLFR